jgi:hypothetical protein
LPQDRRTQETADMIGAKGRTAFGKGLHGHSLSYPGVRDFSIVL